MEILFLSRVISPVILFILFSCQNSEIRDKVVNSTLAINQTDTIGNFKIQSRVFKNNDSIGGWGYDIIRSDVNYIHQTNIPALSGKVGFNSKEDAQKVADLVIKKLYKSNLPPSISLHELDSLKIK